MATGAVAGAGALLARLDLADLADLMAMVAGGDRAAFGQLYRRTAPKLFASAIRILGRGSAAEDAVQEAYVRIWRRAGDFDRAIASPIAWMSTIARHAAIDIARRGGERVSAASTEIDGAMAETLAAPASDGDPMVRTRLTGCLDALDGDRRQMVVLAYCFGFSREELAQKFGRPVPTVKTVLRRSLELLKECLGGRN